MFTLRIPNLSNDLSDPFFADELRRTHRQSLTRYGLTVLLVPFIAVLVLWLLSVVIFALGHDTEKLAVFHTFRDVVSVLLWASLYATPLAMLILDVYSMVVTVKSISHEVNSGQQQELHNTYIPAKHVLAQVRAWRVLALEICIRMLGVVLLIVAYTFTGGCWDNIIYNIHYAGCNIHVQPLVADLMRSFSYDFLTNSSLLGIAIIVVVAYLLEPLWRMRALTALGLMIAARIRNRGTAYFVAVVALVGVHLMEVVIISSIFVADVALAGYFWRTKDPSWPITVLTSFGAVLVIVILLAAFFWAVHRFALRSAQWALFHAE